MDLLAEIEKTIVENFKLRCYLKALDKEITNIAEQKIFQKYKGTIIIRNNLQYELYGVSAVTCNDGFYFKICNVYLTLTYLLISKINLTDSEKKILSKAKKNYNYDKSILNYNGKHNLLIEENYYLEPELIFNDNINLIIKDKKTKYNT